MSNTLVPKMAALGEECQRRKLPLTSSKISAASRLVPSQEPVAIWTTRFLYPARPRKKKLKVLSYRLEMEVHRQIPNVNEVKNVVPTSQALLHLLTEHRIPPLEYIFTSNSAPVTHLTAALLHHPAKQWSEALSKFFGKQYGNPII
ncbi:hypothetical protein PR048_023483 [Dryococelus australis]|uniref:Uncharacterized protein n=1 Tax=Dryococelus australis TaxID=614101 RepID=A0ABQ9GU86_9NEOP|nr:hypothetical protein PR048_023483 [Dryococelus australis]